MSPGTESSPRVFPHPPEGIEIAEDAWLGERFGRPVFTVRLVGAAPNVFELFEQMEARGREQASYQVRIDAADSELASDLQGFFDVVGATLTLTRPTGPEGVPESAGEVRPAVADDAEAVGEIAARGFAETRFHTDPEIPEEVARVVKRDWAVNLVRGERGDGIWVAERERAVIGFLGRVQAADGAGVIDLVAVDREARSVGAGAALVRRFLGDARERGEDRARVGTQVANPRALAFYERLGFRAERAELDLHSHIGKVWPGARDETGADR